MSIKLKSTKKLNEVVTADMMELFWDKPRRGSDDEDDYEETYGHDDDVPENGISDMVMVGTPAQELEVEFDSMSSYIIL